MRNPSPVPAYPQGGQYTMRLFTTGDTDADLKVTLSRIEQPIPFANNVYSLHKSLMY